MNKEKSPIPSSKARPDSKALAETRLRDASVRVTAARVQVLSALLEARSALSHQDVQDMLGEMDRVTLYRALDCLTDAGLAHKIAGDDRVFRYSVGADHQGHGHGGAGDAAQHQHGHFKCTLCARVFCIDELDAPGQAALHQELQQTLKQALGQGFQSHDIELTIKGWCADCAH